MGEQRNPTIPHFPVSFVPVHSNDASHGRRMPPPQQLPWWEYTRAWIRYHSIQWRWDIERAIARLLHRQWR